MKLVPGATNTAPVIRARGQTESVDDFLRRLLQGAIDVSSALQRLENAFMHRRFASSRHATEMDGTCIQTKHLSSTYFGDNALSANALRVCASVEAFLDSAAAVGRSQRQALQLRTQMVRAAQATRPGVADEVLHQQSLAQLGKGAGSTLNPPPLHRGGSAPIRTNPPRTFSTWTQPREDEQWRPELGVRAGSPPPPVPVPLVLSQSQTH